MSLRAYSEINLHFVWRVKDNDPVRYDETFERLERIAPPEQAR